MTYPPQQPGPYGQQNPWGQQQFPPQQQPPSQAPPWLSGDPGGFPSFEPEPKKSRGGVVALVVILALLVLGGGGFGVYLLVTKDDSEPTGGGGGGGDDARAVAEKYVEELQNTVNTKIEDVDVSAMEPMTCADDFGRMEKEIGDAKEAVETATGKRPAIKVGLEDFESSEDKGSFTLTQSIDGTKGPDKEMSMGKEDGAWKVCGLYSGSGGEEPEKPTSAEKPSKEPTGEAPNSGPVPNPIPTG